MYQHTKGNKDSDKRIPYLVIGLDWGASSPSWYRLPPGNLWEPWCPLSEFWQPLFYCSASILLHTHLHTVLHLQWINLDLNKSVAPSKIRKIKKMLHLILLSPAWPTDLAYASWQSQSSLSPTYLALDWGQTLWVSGVLVLDTGEWWPDHQSEWSGGGLVQLECWICAQLSRKPNKHCIQNFFLNPFIFFLAYGKYCM